MLSDEEKALLFDMFMACASLEVERRFNGRRILKIAIGVGSREQEKDPLIRKLSSHYDQIRSDKSKQQRYEEYLKLKQEFELE